MIASSATVWSNLGYLVGAVVLAVIGGLAVWLKHRKPKSVDANVASFRRGLSALAPDGGSHPPVARPRSADIDTVAAGLTHVRLERVEPPERPSFIEEADKEGPDIEDADTDHEDEDGSVDERAFRADRAGGERG